MDLAPWGIGAWQFLGLYWAAFTAALAAAVVVVALVRHKAENRVVDTTPLDYYQLAWIAGGPTRVEEVALAVLLAADQVRVDPRGVVVQRMPPLPVADPLGQWLLATVGPGRVLTGAGSLGFATTRLCRSMVDDLARRGHAVPGGKASPGYGCHWAVGVVFGVGVARLVAELDWQWQVGILLISLVVSGALWFGVAFAFRSGETRPSAAGRAALAVAADRVGRIEDVRAACGWVPVVVAVEGITSYPDRQGEVIAAHTRPVRAPAGR